MQFKNWTFSKVIQMIGTESLIDCLRTSFGRIRSRRNSRVGLSKGHSDDWDRFFNRLPTYLFWEDQVKTQFKSLTYPKVIQMIGIESLTDCLRTSFGRIRSRRSSRDLTYLKVMQVIGTESLMDCLCTSFGRIRSRRNSRDYWKTLDQPW